MTTTTANPQAQYGEALPTGLAPNGTKYYVTGAAGNAIVGEFVSINGAWVPVGGNLGNYTTVALLTAAAPASATTKGMRASVNDSNAAFTAGIGAVVAGGGANIVPVFCDGTDWRIG